MAHRSFTDTLGRIWDVWDVVPTRIERRRAGVVAGWRGAERRRHREFRVRLGERWTRGWLAFATTGERRRLAPFPPSWMDLPAWEFETLLDQAEPIRSSDPSLE